MGTDDEWEEWGRTDPYHGVVTFERYRRENLTEDVREEFFASGRNHVEHVLAMCRRHFDGEFTPLRAVDFGCGTGRLLVPLARAAESVVGLDVSDSMLAEARRNCERFSVTNVTLLKSDDELSHLDGSFDFVNSVIVFQHIPADRGQRIFRRLLGHLENGGICAVQFIYSIPEYARSHGLPPRELPLVPTLRKLKKKVATLAKRLIGGHDPEMQMNPYDVNQLLFTIQSLGVREVHAEFTDHEGHLGIYLYFRKPSDD
jgi:SAM-dependent methyltransferase